ncbi:hypothetical protein [uncultured Brachyspira sp.]|uniref:hypothetical protein n=1 Tax=uncultured Brachyspira sp. TaxID=221953 RepID=UPI00258A00BE|nr:hypothetical protein [uncultured Brachyspira sp.]
MKSKQIIIMLLSFIILFAISCKNDDKTGGSGYSVPKATGDKATDLTTQAEYSGTLRRTVHEGPSDTGLTSLEFGLLIENNKVKGGALGAFAGGADFPGTQVYKSGSEYSAYSSYNSADGSYVDEGDVKEYIKFTISGNTVNVIEYIASVTYDGGYKDTYSGTLTKTTSAGS